MDHVSDFVVTYNLENNLFPWGSHLFKFAYYWDLTVPQYSTAKTKAMNLTVPQEEPI